MWRWPFPKKSVMEAQHKELIDGNIVDLSRTTKNLTELMRCLEMDGVLNLYDISLINKANSNGEKCYKFYRILLKKDALAFKNLVKALMKTGNERLAKFLWEDEWDKSILTITTTTLGNPDGQEVETLENAVGAKIVKKAPRAQSRTSIFFSVMVMGIAAAFPVSVGIYMFKAWVDRILGR